MKKFHSQNSIPSAFSWRLCAMAALRWYVVLMNWVFGHRDHPLDRAPRVTRTLIICGDCCDPLQRSVRKTFLAENGACAGCGGTAWVLASVSSRSWKPWIGETMVSLREPQSDERPRTARIWVS